MRPATNHHLAAPRHSLTIILTVLALLLSPAHRNRSAAASDLEVCSSCQFTSLAEAIDLAEPGAEIVVRGGEYPGGLVIGKSLTLTGIDHPVIDGGNSGTLVFAKDVDLTMSGFTLRRTGSVHDKEDSAIVVEGGVCPGRATADAGDRAERSGRQRGGRAGAGVAVGRVAGGRFPGGAREAGAARIERAIAGGYRGVGDRRLCGGVGAVAGRPLVS